MQNIRWQLLIAIGGLILVVGLLVGQTPGLQTAAPQPVAGGSYAEALLGNVIRLNPILDTNNQVDRDIDRLIYSGLVRFDSRGVPLPDLAEDWAVSADARLYTVTLRGNAMWHDGEPVVSDDIVYTFSKFQDSDYPGPKDLQALWQKVNIVRLDDHTVQFQLSEPFAPFLDYLSIGLLPDHLLRGVSAGDLVDHPFNLEPIGTGPFRFDRFLMDDGDIAGVSLAAFDGFYLTRPYLERFELFFYTTSQDMLKAYQSGEVQGLGMVDSSILGQVLADQSLNLYSARLPEIGLVFLNTRSLSKPFFGEKKVRQALMMAINRQWVIDTVMGGQAVVASGPILPDTWASAGDLGPVPFDPQASADLLETVGWELPTGAVPGAPDYVRRSDDNPLEFTLAYPDDPHHEAVAQDLEQAWADIGVRVTLEPVDPETLYSDYLQPRDYEAVLTEINLSRFPDPDPYPFWHDAQAETGQNYGGYSDRNVSIWLEQARTTPDLGRRAQLYRNFLHRFYDQQPALLLYTPVRNFALNGDLQGVTVGPLFDPSDRFAGVTQWHLLARRGPAPTPSVVPSG
ncbi:MAG TPA: ABC transporter substrate-binding protein [Anaerolineales bacterium]|nr:ABC transporter substrate-binding protein [Anaerolineales bacterium]